VAFSRRAVTGPAAFLSSPGCEGVSTAFFDARDHVPCYHHVWVDVLMPVVDRDGRGGCRPRSALTRMSAAAVWAVGISRTNGATLTGNLARTERPYPTSAITAAASIEFAVRERSTGTCEEWTRCI
jgi:hypothetical protein